MHTLASSGCRSHSKQKACSGLVSCPAHACPRGDLSPHTSWRLGPQDGSPGSSLHRFFLPRILSPPSAGSSTRQWGPRVEGRGQTGHGHPVCRGGALRGRPGSCGKPRADPGLFLAVNGDTADGEEGIGRGSPPKETGWSFEVDQHPTSNPEV